MRDFFSIHPQAEHRFPCHATRERAFTPANWSRPRSAVFNGDWRSRYLGDFGGRMDGVGAGGC
ncbi:hypothetical protein ABZ357_08610 [Streptomyces sp. NPDC005917]|uniref:hypothetical protein n=1 Tax=unclassified Streptomyces TaxID=2593676 RepID=UPI0033CBDCA9